MTVSFRSLSILLGLLLPTVLAAQNHEIVTISSAVGIGGTLAKSASGHHVTPLERGQIRVQSHVVDVPLQADRPFLALSVQWLAEVANAHQVEIAVRGSTDGSDWTEWLGVGIDHHVELEAGRFSGELVFLPHDIRHVQYQALITPTLLQMRPSLDTVLLHFINPGVTDTDDLDAFRNTASTLMQESSAETAVRPRGEGLTFGEGLNFSVSSTTNPTYALPTYVNRVQWGGTLNLTNTAPRSQTTVSHLIVHHSAGHNTSLDFAAVVRSYYLLHTQTNGWSDIGYNWLIDRNGVLYQGRAFNFNGSPDVIGAHMGGGNSFTMGVCLIGDFTNVQPTEVALTQLRNVLAWKAHERAIDVRVRRTHTLGNLHTISGHRDGSATQCPGNAFYPRLPEVRSRTHAYLNPPQIVSTQVVVAAANPSQATLRLQIHTKGSAVAGYIEYGLLADDLTNETETFSLLASETPELVEVQIAALTSGTRYFFRVVAVNAETVSYSEVASFVAGETTSIEDPSRIPADFLLAQNYPNPFNPTSTIAFELPESGAVRVLVYTMQGRLVRVLADRVYSAGRHEVVFEADGFASGVYVYSLEVGGRVVQTRKMTLLE